MRHRKAAIIIAVFFIAITAATWLWAQQQEPPIVIDDGTVLPADGKLHVLIVGEDAGPNAGTKARGRSDTLMVASYDPKSGEVSLLSIPRDTLVEIPGRPGRDKINHAFAFGGIDLTLRTVRQFLNIPIRYYVHVQTDGFRRMVDALGGVPLYVEKDMRYTDRAGGLYINLKQGEQVLNGEQAEGYVRYRQDSDIARIQRQQKFLAAALKEVLKPSNWLKINQLFKIFNESVRTNIPVSVAMRYLSIVGSLKNSNVTSYTIEGKDDVWINGINYFEADEKKLAELIETYFYAGVDQARNQQVRVRVAVGNGDYASGEQVADLLRRSGFQILSITTADRSDYLVSQVMSSSEQAEAAAAVAEALTLHEILVNSEVNDTADVVVIVGKDMLP